MKILNIELLENSVEQILSRRSIRSHYIYNIILFLIISTFILLPIIKITISIKSDGVIRPIKEKVEIKSLVTGIIKRINYNENEFVKKGEIILTIDNKNIKNKINVIKSKINLNNQYIIDLQSIIKKLNLYNFSKIT